MAASSVPTDTAVAAVVNPPTSPRKRRRRAPTTGAADDCFACQDRHTQCDRKRPYCTQCLGRGKDCSGYKTTLTWGVGVASRGKLRGLSLPVPKSKKVDPVDNKPSKKSNSTGGSKSSSSQDGSKKQGERSFVKPNLASYNHVPTTFGFVNVDPNAASPSPIYPPSYQWPTNPPAGNNNNNMRTNVRPSGKKGRRHSLEPLHVPVQIRDYGTVPMTAIGFGGFHDHSFESPIEASPMTSSFHPLDGQMPMYKAYPVQQNMMGTPIHDHFFAGPHVGSWPPEPISSSLGSDQSSRDFQEDGFFVDPVVADTLDHILGNQSISSIQEFDEEDEKVKKEPMHDQHTVHEANFHLLPNHDDHGMSRALDLSPSIPTVSIGKTPRIRFLINYYDKVISPVIVAFESQSNPYRTHILRLAERSETLQHAIAALSASNLRMRREHNPSGATQPRLCLENTPHDHSVRKSSIAHTILNDDLKHASETMTNPGVPSKEELYHKGESIRSLNAQLADPSHRTDDSILATLLVLCLYHICDTGVAKFKTQFAGVKKILALRKDGRNSKETNWLTTMFMWFDAMTATVNDREGQFESIACDTAILDNDEWTLENLAGCDGRLFRTISKLGRLNLLSQGKPVADLPANSTPTPQPQPMRSPDYYSMNYNHLDGNGWAPILEQDEDIFAPDARTQFWKEWNEIRKKLMEWELDSSCLPTPMCDPSLEVNRRDLQSISESFRFSALLYTERLAYPDLPSMADNFQRLVQRSLYHITHVKSDVYLLWPLFITGTECVEESHRAIIRERCMEIQKDSGFFNNISGLELLEKIWRNADRESSIHGAMGSSEHILTISRGFKWRKAMTNIDGEYIVI